MGWALSCLQLRKFYPRISLYTNTPAAQLLIETLSLPCTNVHLLYDLLTLAHPQLWAQPIHLCPTASIICARGWRSVHFCAFL